MVAYIWFELRKTFAEMKVSERDLVNYPAHIAYDLNYIILFFTGYKNKPESSDLDLINSRKIGEI
jgi:hypothetical protein